MARQIAETPALLGEARAVLTGLQHVATAKAGTEGVKAVIGRRLALYPQPVRNEVEAAAWWADYYDTLADVALASLEAAMRAYVALPSSEFMPKPGRLLELSTTTPCRSLQRYYRAKRAIQFAEEPEPVVIAPEVAAANAAEIRSMLAGFDAKMAAAPANRPDMPSTSGAVDQGGLTKEMRALMARRQGLGG